jgi:hypothetical protein
MTLEKISAQPAQAGHKRNGVFKCLAMCVGLKTKPGAQWSGGPAVAGCAFAPEAFFGTFCGDKKYKNLGQAKERGVE